MTAPLVAKAPCDVDVIAREIARVAALAKQMPPAWDGAKVAHGFTAPGGENLGRVLPGRGVALASDLRSLGITKPIPHVFEKSLAMRTIEACGGRERLAMALSAGLLAAKLGALGMGEALMGLPAAIGAITNYDGIINGRANGKGQDVALFTSAEGSVAGHWTSLFRTSTQFPGGAFAPAGIPGGTAPNRTTVGALSAGLNNPTGGDKKYLLTVGYTSGATLNIALFVDLLAASSGVIANVATPQTVNTPALTRYAGTESAGNLITLEVIAALGATASNVTVNSYTNSAGTAGRTTPPIAMTASAVGRRLQPTPLGPFMQLAAGDLGVRSVEQVTFSAAMGAGACNLYIYRPLHFLPGVGANVYVERDSTVQIDGLTELVVGTDSQLGMLGFFVLTSGTSTGNFTAFLRTVAG